MGTTQVNVHEAKTQLSKLINELGDGDEVVIANRGTPIARLVPFVVASAPRPLGSVGTGQSLDDAMFEDLAPVTTDDQLDELGWPR